MLFKFALTNIFLCLNIQNYYLIVYCVILNIFCFAKTTSLEIKCLYIGLYVLNINEAQRKITDLKRSVFNVSLRLVKVKFTEILF